jgi:3-hydroxybutyryl-CoA dehydratase
MMKSAGTRFERDFASVVEGQRFTTVGRTITREDVVSVQSAGGEATDSGPGDVAPAALVLAYAVGLVPLVDERILAVRRRGDVAFERPAYVGDTIHVEVTIDGVETVDDETGIVRMIWAVVNQSGELVGRMDVDALWRSDAQRGVTYPEQDYVKRESSVAVPT